jgi:outer membrane protein OmpA-like peptidoglycan-associated protein
MRTNLTGTVSLLLAFLFVSHLHGQDTQGELAPGNYVVVATFVKTDIAFLENFVKSKQRKDIQFKTGFESSRNNYYVYVYYSANIKEAIQAMEKTRETPGLETAWVHVIKAHHLAHQQHHKDGTPVEPKKELATDGTNPKEATPVGETPALVEKEKSENTQGTTVTTTIPETHKHHAPLTPSLAHNKVIFHIKEANTKKILAGEVQIIDTEKTRLMNKVNSNELFTIKDPKTKSGKLTLICEVFGYRKSQQTITFPTPAKEEATLSGDVFTVNFELLRYEKGDMATLYQVFFHNDAAIMLPESKYELFQLLDMMHENPNLKIVLHGHTNGDSRGKIITMGPSRDFFNLTKDVKTSSGSSTKLSNERALAIREWLLSKGIDPNRVDVKPWGGKKMLHEETSVHAKKNIRVEVEVIEN